MIRFTPRKIAIGIVVFIVAVGIIAITVIAPPLGPFLTAALAVGAIFAEEALKVLIEKIKKKFKKNKASKDEAPQHFSHYESVHLDTPKGLHFTSRKYSCERFDDDDDNENIIRRKLKLGG